MFKRYKYVSQIDMRDCGIAALASIIQHYGSYYSLATLRKLAKTDNEGTTALGIIEAAKSCGFDAQAIQADRTLFNIKDIPYPFIVHVNKNHKLQHYYVVYGIKKEHIIIGDPDPQVKVVKMPKEKFFSEWSGAAIFILPSNKYHIFKEKKKGLLSFIPEILNHKKIIFFIALTSILATFISILGSYYLQEILDQYIPKQMYSTLGIISIGLIFTYIIQQALNFLKELFLETLSVKLTSKIFLSYIQHVFSLPFDFFATRRTGEIVSRFTDATTIIDTLASIILSTVLDMTVLFFVGITMLIQNSQLFLLTLLAIPIYSIIILVFMPTFNRMNNEVMHANSKISSTIIEDINGIETIKSLNGEEMRFQLINNEVTKYLNKSFKLNMLEHLQDSLKQTCQLILTVGILWVGANLVIENQISIGQLITYNTLLFYFVNPLENIINLQTKLQSASVANTRLNDIYLVETEHNTILSSVQNPTLNVEITFNDVSYHYGFRKNTLDHINLTIKPGEKICFVGASGSGKSTLAKHFVNFYSPTKGDILLNSTSIEKIDKKQLRSYINYLPQEAYIFSGSIIENLTLGTTDKVDEQDIISACQTAEILSDIEKMPLGFQTEVSDGSGLSGGQKQRIAIARALLTNSPVLILDEATSGLDILTEKKIINNLLSLHHKTIIFIAHRLSIAKQCDKIYVIDKGCIVEEGSHDDLMMKNGIYSQLVNG